MDGAACIGDRLRGEPVRVSAEYEGIPGDIARGRELARLFLARVRAARGPGCPTARWKWCNWWSASC